MRTISLILIFIVLIIISSCELSRCKEDEIVKIEYLGYLSTSEQKLIPYKVGDTICLINSNDTICLVCDSSFNTFFVLGITQISKYVCDGLKESRGEKTGYIFRSREIMKEYGNSKITELKIQLAWGGGKNSLFFITFNNKFDGMVSICDSCDLVYILDDDYSRYSKYFESFTINNYSYNNVIGFIDSYKPDTTGNPIDSVYFNRDYGIIQIVYKDRVKYSISPPSGTSGTSL
jgi:hypothetical protein